MTFLNAALLWGLIAAAAPIVIHIFHRTKVKKVDWGAMRFLVELLIRSRRRLMIQEWLLLLVRMGLIFLVALALTRPAWLPDTSDDEAAAESLKRGGAVAAVLVFDDSVSTGAGRGRTRLDEMKRLADAYIRSLEQGDDGDEISIIRLSRIDEPPADPLYDLEAARKIVQDIETTGATSDVPALLEAGLAQFARHIIPQRELVLITDGGAEGWRLDERPRWAELRKAFAGVGDGGGGADRPRLVLLSPERATETDNVALLDVRVDHAHIAAGRPVGIHVRVGRRGEKQGKEGLLRLHVDGRVVDERELDLPDKRYSEIVFRHTFEEPGSHVIEAVVEGVRDGLARDNRRALAVAVSKSMPVLLVEGDTEGGLRSSLRLLSLALDPTEDGKGMFLPTRVSAADLAGTALDKYLVVVLGDVPALDATSVAALERFLVAGGGVLVGLGPQTDVELANRFWAREGDGFLPAPLGAFARPEPAVAPATANLGHPALAAFRQGSAEAWKGSKVGAYHKIDAKAIRPGELQVLLTLDNGDPLIVERRRGLGRSVLIASSLNLAWSDLAVHHAYVPLMRGLVGHLGSTVQPPRNLRPGGRIIHAAPTDAGELTAEGPDGEPFELTLGTWEGKAAYESKPLHQDGVYRVLDTEGAGPVYYALAVDPAECRLEAIEKTERDKALGGIDLVPFSDAAKLTASLDPTSDRPVEFWQKLLLGALALLFLESFITRRQSRRERGKAADASQTAGAAGAAA